MANDEGVAQPLLTSGANSETQPSTAPTSHVEENAGQSVEENVRPNVNASVASNPHHVEQHAGQNAEQSTGPNQGVSRPPTFRTAPFRQDTGVSNVASEKASRWNNSRGRLRIFASPSYHGPYIDPDTPELTTVQPYKHGEQFRRLWRKTWAEWAMTLVLCGCIAGVLVAYSKMDILERPQRHSFNVIITGLSVGLGLNLIASLKSYAKMLRWRLLASGYRSLEEFELILGCHQQANVMKLLWATRNRKRPYLPTGSQILCVVWIAVILGAAISVSVLGLTYAIEGADFYALSTGNVSLVDLSYVSANNITESNYYTELGAAHTNGIQGQGFSVIPVTGDPSQGYSQSIEAVAEFPDYSEYWFGDQNPANPEDNVITGRSINVTANCVAYNVLNDYAVDGNLTYGNNTANWTMFLPTYSAGGIVFISETNSTCGDRCTNITAFQAKLTNQEDKTTEVLTAQVFHCINEVGLVYPLPDLEPEAYKMPDLQAKMLAGAIGWEGLFTENVTYQYQGYPLSTPQAPRGTASEDEVSLTISQFTSKAIANMDDRGARRNATSNILPAPAVHLRVDWKYAGAALGVIPFVHFLSLLAVILWANKAIIKDETYLSISKLYQPLVGELGTHGCLMRGDQIVSRFGNPKVAYGFKDGKEGADGREGVKHVDVFREDSGMQIAPKFSEGEYDGDGWDDTPETRPTRVKEKME